ncbi:hypothetical protein RUM43_006745 [Polyplax serrata]|uniref:Ribosome biogenesis protein BRX1 homolog n=1 Tax=Polyplax serrata TaxID=468196 RepID=A0AAN8S0R4_POLSC
MKKKGTLKRKFTETEEPVEEELPPTTRRSDEPVKKKVKWINKQRVLVLALRGGTHLHRHLMEDIRTLLPHAKKDNKVEKTNNLGVLNEIAESKNCNKSVLFETRRKNDLYIWMSNHEGGPSAKFGVESIYTMKELKLTGNCLKGSRPLLTFDETFTKEPHYQLLKELFVQIFSTPNHHPKSQPFIDHVLTFSVVDNKIWFRNYQILSEDGALAEIGKTNTSCDTSLCIFSLPGPRFVLNPVKIFSGSYGGEVLWDNPNYISTTMFRRLLNKKKGNRYLERKEQKEHFEETRPEKSYELNPTLEIFRGNPLEKATEIIEGKTETSEEKETEKRKPKKLKKNKGKMTKKKLKMKKTKTKRKDGKKLKLKNLQKKVKGFKVKGRR